MAPIGLLSGCCQAQEGVTRSRGASRPTRLLRNPGCLQAQEAVTRSSGSDPPGVETGTQVVLARWGNRKTSCVAVSTPRPGFDCPARDAGVMEGRLRPLRSQRPGVYAGFGGDEASLRLISLVYEASQLIGFSRFVRRWLKPLDLKPHEWG